jgi:hypothetical protein
MNIGSVQHTTLANYMVNISIMFIVSNTLPGTYVTRIKVGNTCCYTSKSPGYGFLTWEFPTSGLCCGHAFWILDLRVSNIRVMLWTCILSWRIGSKHLFLGLFGSLQLWLKPETFELPHHHACLSFLFTGGRGRKAIQNRSAENMNMWNWMNWWLVMLWLTMWRMRNASLLWLLWSESFGIGSLLTYHLLWACLHNNFILCKISHIQIVLSSGEKLVVNIVMIASNMPSTFFGLVSA